MSRNTLINGAGMILVTGATGFVGRAVIELLVERGCSVRAALRRDSVPLPEAVARVRVKDLAPDNDWSVALVDVNVVIHAAARVHVMEDKAVDPLTEFRRANVEGTLNLARQAASRGVRRFVFISSVGVSGAETVGAPFNADDAAAPHSPYAWSKYEAELGLKKLAEQSGLEVVIIRPPLVYGSGAPGNFGALVRWLLRGVPLPLGAVDNRRSYVALDNLADLIVTCIDHPAAVNQTFLVSDGEDLSTTDLLRRLGRALGKPARLLPVPPALLKLGATMLGKPEFAQRLCGSLQVDISKTRQLLGWSPPVSVDEGLKRAAEGYLREASV